MFCQAHFSRPTAKRLPLGPGGAGAQRLRGRGRQLRKAKVQCGSELPAEPLRLGCAEPPPLKRGGFGLCSPHGSPCEGELSAKLTERSCGRQPRKAKMFRRIRNFSSGPMRRPQASFEAQPRFARLLAPKMGIGPYKTQLCIRVIHPFHRPTGSGTAAARRRSGGRSRCAPSCRFRWE